MPSLSASDLPVGASTVVVGGGTAGAALAARLVEAGDEVLLLEAGPDYGHRSESRWPGPLLDALRLPLSHDWGYDSGDTYSDRTVRFGRARVIGGCSAHNGCAAIWGSRLDYDGWRDLGNEGWGTDDLLPYFRRASQQLRVRIFGPEEMTPFHGGFIDAAAAVGIPRVADLNDVDEDEGVGANPANIDDGVRWNTSIAYLDRVRGRRGLTVLGDALVDRVALEGGRCRGVSIALRGETRLVGADRVVLAGGTYGSPAVLQRSGIGDPGDLARAGIRTVHELPGVGRNLHDHPSIYLVLEGTAELRAQTDAFARQHWAPDEQAIAKVRSSRCERGFDLHVFTYCTSDPEGVGGWRWVLQVACLTPRSRGHLRVTGPDPEASPVIDHRYLSDPEGEDLRVLVDGLRTARRIAAHPDYAILLGGERTPGAGVQSQEQMEAYAGATCEHYFHPVGTCKMAPASDPGAVVDSRAAVHGIESLHVADCSIMPVVPRANTNIPAAVVGERVAALLS